MPRTATDAVERKKQRDEAQQAIASQLGVDHVTVRTAAEVLRKDSRAVHRIKQRELDLEDERVEPLGVVLGRIEDYKVVKGTVAQLNVATNAQEFGHILLDASLASRADILVIAMFTIPRDLGLDGEDDHPDAVRLGGSGADSGD